MKVHIDFETRSVVDLITSGAYKYAQDLSTEVLCIAYCFGGGEIKLWTRGSAPPQDLWEAAIDPRFQFHAFNVGFERRIWQFVLHQRLGWPATDIEKWYDTQADAVAMGYPDQLGRCAKAMHLEYQKSAQGTKLINLLSKPIAKSDPPKFRQRIDFPKYFFDLYDYCKQDVRVEREISRKLTIATTANGKERRVWAMTERMNDAGVPVDIVLANSLWTMIEDDLKPKVLARLHELTDFRVTTGNQTSRMNEELEHRMPSFNAEQVKKGLACPLRGDRDKEILRARQVLSKSSTAKYARMRDGYCKDGFVRDILQYHGAATGRYAGRGIQIQNFPRKSPENAERISRDAIDPAIPMDEFEKKHGEVQEVAKMMLRPTIRAPEKHHLICRDYSSIEARACAWAVKDEDQLTVFREGKDIYKDTASMMYGVPYDEVDDEQRQPGKIAVLACGYQGGWKALRDMAALYGVHWTPKESYDIVMGFRDVRPKLVQSWWNFSTTARLATDNPGTKMQVPDFEFCEFFHVDGHLRMELPNGKYLWFPEARMEYQTVRYQTHEGEWTEITSYNVHHMTMTQNVWVRRSIHGGSLFQSYIQAICREIMVEAMLRLEDAGWPLNMTVHDEIVSVVPDKGNYDPDEFERIMTEVPKWAKGFPIKADGWEGRRYRK